MVRKRGLVLASFFFGLGCARTLPLSNYDECGLKGMELEGVRTITGQGQFGGWGRGPLFGEVATTGTEVSCKLPPRDDRERNCEVKAYAAKATFKLNNERRSNGALEEVGKASVAEWQRVYRACMTGAS
jgi:hypothetical protein